MDFGRRFWRFFWARGLLGGVLIGVFFFGVFSPKEGCFGDCGC